MFPLWNEKWKEGETYPKPWKPLPIILFFISFRIVSYRIGWCAQKITINLIGFRFMSFHIALSHATSSRCCASYHSLIVAIFGIWSLLVRFLFTFVFFFFWSSLFYFILYYCKMFILVLCVYVCVCLLVWLSN